jgi:hypothetical protein
LGSGGSTSTATSEAPGTVFRTLATLPAMRRTSSRSLPKIFTVRSLCAPDNLSCTPSIIGCMKATV